MTEEAKNKRDELANQQFCVCCVHYDEAYKLGFDAGYQTAMDEANDKIYHATRKVPELEYEKEHLRLTLLSECKNHKYSLDRIEDLKERIQKLREALEFYGNGNYFENGVISSKDIEPAEKIAGSVIYHYTDPPEKYHIFIGGKTARAALKEDDL